MPPGVGDRAALLALSDERDTQLALRLAAWRDGYRAAAAQFAAYESAGFLRAVASFKAFQQREVTDLRQHLVTWDGLRTRFGNPRPGDFPGRGGAP
jgi:hypothetical protein